MSDRIDAIERRLQVLEEAIGDYVEIVRAYVEEGRPPEPPSMEDAHKDFRQRVQARRRALGGV